jgi:signal peptidase I
VRRVLAIAALVVTMTLALVLLTIVVLVATGTMKLYAIPTSAMEPTLHCARPGPGCEAGTHDRVFAFTRLVSYGRGDLVVFDAPPRARRECGIGGTFLKRIVGLPGETLELRLIDGKQHVYVDGERLSEPYVDERRRASGRRARFAIPEGSYFVLGDNRAVSCDSIDWGPLPGDDFTGKLVGTYWPPGRWTIR